MPPFSEGDLTEDPIDLFEEWFTFAGKDIPLAEAVCLATVDADGLPDARMVLLKGFGPDGFRFFTNLHSAKARHLEAVARAALILYWRALDRQVLLRGGGEKLCQAVDDN